MLNKFKYLFIREPGIKLRLAIIVVLIIGSIALLKTQKMQIGQLEKLNQKKSVVTQIPLLKKQIETISLAAKSVKQEPKKQETQDPVLKGIFMQNNLYYALFDDTFYQKGDTLDNYSILNITINSVVLEDKTTNNTKILSLPD